MRAHRRLHAAAPPARAVRALVAMLALMLAVTHAGALLHAIGHLHEALPGTTLASSSHSVSTDGPQAGDTCLDCLAYAPLASFAASSALAFDAPPAPRYSALPPALEATQESFRPHFLARAPPALA